MRMIVTKGVAKKNGMFIWGIQLVGKSDKRLPAGTVLARTKEVARKKAKTLVKKRFGL